LDKTLYRNSDGSRRVGSDNILKLPDVGFTVDFKNARQACLFDLEQNHVCKLLGDYFVLFKIVLQIGQPQK